MNKVMLVGRFTKDPELKFVSNKDVCNFNLAVDSRNYTSFINCAMWGAFASNIYKHKHKGDLVSVVGYLNVGKDFKMNVIVEEIHYLARVGNNERD